MAHINIEIKARTNRMDEIRKILIDQKAVFKGVDNQTDTYFNVPNGRLKLREGNIENNLIQYLRTNQEGPKQSYFKLLPVSDPVTLKAILTAANGVKVVVAKKREIYYIDNVKFHLDSIEGLGNFVEIEAGNLIRDLSSEELNIQCNQYMEAFGIKQEDLIAVSYSDMLLDKG